MNTVSIFTEYIYLINVNAWYGLAAIEFAIPARGWIIHREIVSFEDHLSPAVKYSQAFYSFQSAAAHIKYIVHTVSVGGEGIGQKHICILAERDHLYRSCIA